MRIPKNVRLAAAVFGLTLIGCGTVPATIVNPPTGPLTKEPRIFVSAPREDARIAESLDRAGLRVVHETGAQYILHVKIGVARKSQSCGTMNNVAYDLRDAAKDQEVLLIEGRGWTGACEPSIWDEMSQLLARQVTAAAFDD